MSPAQAVAFKSLQPPRLAPRHGEGTSFGWQGLLVRAKSHKLHQTLDSKLRITHYLGKTQAIKETGNQGDLPGTLQKHQKKEKLQEAVSAKTGVLLLLLLFKSWN